MQNACRAAGLRRPETLRLERRSPRSRRTRFAQWSPALCAGAGKRM